MSEPIRYPYALPRRDWDQLHGELTALGLPGFVGICGSGDAGEVLFEQSLGAGDKARLDEAVSAHVPDPNAERNRACVAAATAVRSDSSSTATAARVAFTVLFTWLNDLREKLDLPRHTETEILTAIENAIQAGDGEPQQG